MSGWLFKKKKKCAYVYWIYSAALVMLPSVSHVLKYRVFHPEVATNNNCRSWKHNFGITLRTRCGDDWVIEVVESHCAGTWQITQDPHFVGGRLLVDVGDLQQPTCILLVNVAQQVKWSCFWKLHYVQDVGFLNNICLKQLAEGQYVLISLFAYCIVGVNPSFAAVSTQWMGRYSPAAADIITM